MSSPGLNRKQWVAAVLASAVIATGISVGAGSSAADGRSGDPVVVDRDLKGDRMPVLSALDGGSNLNAVHSESKVRQAPFACDRAFSPIVDPALADIYRRCMA